MIGATVVTLAVMDVTLALIPLMVGLLAAFVAYGRWRLAPHRSRSHPSLLRRNRPETQLRTLNQ